MNGCTRAAAGSPAVLGRLWLLLVLATPAANAGPGEAPPVVEVFTTTDHRVAIEDARGAADVHGHELDGIQRLQAELSQGLPSQSEGALPVVQARIAAIDGARRRQIQDSAVALARAAQLGIDRFPAIVFDGRVVVYGVTDVVEALDRYRRWQEASGR